MSTNDKFYAINPSSNNQLEGEYTNATEAVIHSAVQKSKEAMDIYRKKDKDSIANFLDQVAQEILNLGDSLLERCHLETALPMARLKGERGRTINQLKLFASVVREGSWIDARIDTAIPERNPFPKSDIRHILQPLGPVAVFGASNFPLAFSVAGGDTASALAAGCTVVVKAHPAHPGTSELVASAIHKAISICGMPEGTFSLIQGNNNAVGKTLVKHPDIKAVGFTGSFGGGKALFDIANSRTEPIPVYAEMGSTNPVFILPKALRKKTETIAIGMANSITLGVGQFCTNPGLTFIEESKEADKYCDYLATSLKDKPSGTMLTKGIKDAYEIGIEYTLKIDGVKEMASGREDGPSGQVAAKIFNTTFEKYSKSELLNEENFGPSTVVITSKSKEQILEAAKNLKGHLTATVHGMNEDFENYKELFDILEQKVGRVIINGYPTGVEVCHSMVHGGPYPSTTAVQSTSVGTNAIKRFVRPICFQDFPESLLPSALHNSNPLNIWRLVNGELMKEEVV